MSSGRSLLAFTSFKTTTGGNDTAYQELLSTLDTWLNSTTLTPLQSKQYDIQKKWIKEETAPGIEILMVPLGGLTMTRPANETSYMIVLTSLQHPFSRGSVVSTYFWRRSLRCIYPDGDRCSTSIVVIHSSCLWSILDTCPAPLVCADPPR